MFFVRLFDLCLFGFVCFSSSWCLGRATACNCATPWTFLLPFLWWKVFVSLFVCCLFSLVSIIGDLLNGEAKVVFTDFDNIKVGWGCTRRSTRTKECHDPWLEVSTRSPNPSGNVWKTVFSKLRKHFGIKRRDIMLKDTSKRKYILSRRRHVMTN